MLKKIIFAAGISYLFRKFTGGRRTAPATSRGGLFGGSRSGRRGNAW